MESTNSVTVQDKETGATYQFSLDKVLGGGWTSKVFRANRISSGTKPEEEGDLVAVKVVYQGGERVLDEPKVIQAIWEAWSEDPTARALPRPMPWAHQGERVGGAIIPGKPIGVIVMEYIDPDRYRALRDVLRSLSSAAEQEKLNERFLESLKRYLHLIRAVHRAGRYIGGDRKMGDFYWSDQEKRLVVLDWNALKKTTDKAIQAVDYRNAGRLWAQMLFGSFHEEGDLLPAVWRVVPTLTLDPDRTRDFPNYKTVEQLTRGARRVLAELYYGKVTDDEQAKETCEEIDHLLDWLRAPIQKPLKPPWEHSATSFTFTTGLMLDWYDIAYRKTHPHEHEWKERAQAIFKERWLLGDPELPRQIRMGEYDKAKERLKEVLGDPSAPPMARVLAFRYLAVLVLAKTPTSTPNEVRRALDAIASLPLSPSFLEGGEQGATLPAEPNTLPWQVRQEMKVWDALRRWHPSQQQDKGRADVLQKYDDCKQKCGEAYAQALRDLLPPLNALLEEAEILKEVMDALNKPKPLQALEGVMEKRRWYFRRQAQQRDTGAARFFVGIYQGLRDGEWRERLSVYYSFYEKEEHPDPWRDAEKKLLKRMIEARMEELKEKLEGRTPLWEQEIKEGKDLEQMLKSLTGTVGGNI